MRLLAVLLPVLLFALPVAAQVPKLVVQAADLGAFEAAAWTPDGRWLVEASGRERMLRIWDPTSDGGLIVDALRLPIPSGQVHSQVWINGLSVDGRLARVDTGYYVPGSAGSEPRAVVYHVDLVTRSVREAKPADGSPAAQPPNGELSLPEAPDGRKLVRQDGAVELLSPDGSQLGQMLFGEKPETVWATASPDGAKVVFLKPKQAEADTRKSGKAAEPLTELVVFNLQTGQTNPYGTSWDNFGDYGRAGWTGDGRLLLSEESSPFGRMNDEETGAKSGEPAAAWLIDLDGGRDPLEVPPLCYVQPLGSERLVGAGLQNCRQNVKREPLLWVRTLEGDWTELPLALPRGSLVDGLRASPDGRLIALSIERGGMVIVDAESGRILHRRATTEEHVSSFNFLPDSRSLVLLDGERPVHWRFAAGSETVMPAWDSQASLIESDGETVLLGNLAGAAVERIRLSDGARLPKLEVPVPIAGGFLAGKPIFWVSNTDGELVLFDSRDWSRIATVQRFVSEDDEYFLVHDPAGRYDSNLAPDYAPFGWLMMDAPFQLLGPQTFMRELYTPDLLARLIACVPDRSCAKALPAAVNLSALNRALPEVSDMLIRPGRVPGTVDVEVTVREGVNSLPSGAYGQARSGMHNLRLFRDEVLVRQVGAPPAGLAPGDKEAWRRATRLVPNMADGGFRARFENVPLPTGAGSGEFRFSAYAFNEDRVRGEEVDKGPDRATQDALAPTLALGRPRRLFLLTIGLDAYPGGLFSPLRYAVADARAMAGLFERATFLEKGRGPLQVVAMRIEGTADRPATRAQIEAAFAQLRQAGPDDVVVVTYSGHGHTDAGGRFYLVPSDVRSEGDRPVPASMIGADDLARWLEPVDAGAIHMVIDACHSAASVQAGGFKPGPMGDPGLGQLAYDKGMTILSASAPDQYALEASDLGHGLLTYAFVVEGAQRGMADEKDEEGRTDGLVTIDELMAYAVRALPDVEARYVGGEGPGLVVERGGASTRRQTPRLFDYAAEWSRLQLPVGAP